MVSILVIFSHSTSKKYDFDCIETWFGTGKQGNIFFPRFVFCIDLKQEIL